MSSNASAQKTEKLLPKRILGFTLAHEQFPVPELVRMGAAAEEAGFTYVGTSDHLQPWQANEGHSGEAWVTMGALSQHLKQTWMGTLVTCPTIRYRPAVVAEAWASMSLLYPGRVFLGVGSGEALNEQAATGEWPAWDERSERLIEAVQIIRQLWTGEQVGHKGKYWTVNTKLYDPPTKPIPLLMAGNGPKALRRAGMHGDGLVSDPKTWKQHKQEFEAGAKAAGKNPGQMPVMLEQYAVVGTKQDAQKPGELWRFGPKAWNPYYNIQDPREIQQRAEKEVPMEKALEGWIISPDPAQHIQQLNRLFDAGATAITIHSGQADQQRVLDFYGKQVIPGLRMPKAA
jgi:TAT-translocated FGD2 family F420-dependent dehydrogenase